MCLWLCLAVNPPSQAETVTMTDGASFAGDIIKFDDNGILLRSGDTYTNLAWGRFSQESLKQLSSNPKIAALVDVFILPDESQRPAKKEIQVNPVKRLERPENPSLFGGLFKSSIGLFLLLLVYAANLYAAYEVSIIRARPALQVIGLSAVLPVIAPIIFLCMSIKAEKPAEEPVDHGHAAPAGTTETSPAAPAAEEEIRVTEASWKTDEKKVEPQVFARGKFTFNKRFIETKFAGYIGSPKGDALKFTMELKSAKGAFHVERITMVTATEVIFEVAGQGSSTVPFGEIQEIKLTPKPA
jgi:hypothetical protein